MVISFIMANKKNNKNKEIMKNLLGKEKNLKLYNDKGGLVYKFYESYNGRWYEFTYDDNGNELIYKNSNGYWCESTYDDRGNELTYKNSNGTLRGFNIPEYTMQELTEKLGNFKIKK